MDHLIQRLVHHDPQAKIDLQLLHHESVDEETKRNCEWLLVLVKNYDMNPMCKAIINHC